MRKVNAAADGRGNRAAIRRAGAAERKTLSGFSRRELGQLISYLPQSRPVPGISVQSMVLHDLGLALSYAGQLAVMQFGRLVFAGSPQEVLESGCLEQVFWVWIQKGGLQKSGGYLFFPAGPKEEKDGEI